MFMFLAIVFIGCNTMDNKKFVEIYGNSDFSAFKNTSMFIRDNDIINGDEIIFAYDGAIPSSLNNGAYVITMDNKKEVIRKTSCHLMKDSTIADKKKLERLALQFIKYPIGNLSVDSNNNVLISLRANTSTDLIRFSDTKYKHPKYDTWVQIKDNWYKNKIR